jgi:hypothetical protein
MEGKTLSELTNRLRALVDNAATHIEGLEQERELLNRAMIIMQQLAEKDQELTKTLNSTLERALAACRASLALGSKIYHNANAHEAPMDWGKVRTLLTQALSAAAVSGVADSYPYPWCRQKDVCRGKGSCPLDPNCGD